MDFDRICLGCMKMKPEGESVCPACGFDPDKYTSDSDYALPLMTILHGRYLVGKHLGAGGFGVTYIGYDTTLEVPVAIKEFFMRGSMFRDSTVSTLVTLSQTNKNEQQVVESSYRKFRKEALTLARLNQLPGIVHVHDCFEENNTMYIVMDYLSGQTLKSYVKNKGSQLTWEETLELVKPVIKSLGKLHDQDILHRDISPDNMMFGADGNLSLIDFGGVKEEYVENGDQRSSLALMKPGYSPIEQMSVSGKQGPWTDGYAMAATIYFCLCGNAPIDALSRVNGEELIDITTLNKSVTKVEAEVLEKALSLKAADRFPNMESLLSALENASAGKTLKSNQPKTDIPVTKAEKKSSKIGLVAALAAAVIVGGAGSHFLFSGNGNSSSAVTEQAAEAKSDTTVATKSETESSKVETTANTETTSKTYKSGETAVVDTEYGTYKITMNGAIISQRNMNQGGDTYYQITYVEENESFDNGDGLGTGIYPDSFDVTDDQGNVCTQFNEYYNDEAANAYERVGKGRKIEKKAIYKVVDPSSKSINVVMTARGVKFELTVDGVDEYAESHKVQSIDVGTPFTIRNNCGEVTLTIDDVRIDNSIKFQDDDYNLVLVFFDVDNTSYDPYGSNSGFSSFYDLDSMILATDEDNYTVNVHQNYNASDINGYSFNNQIGIGKKGRMMIPYALDKDSKSITLDFNNGTTFTKEF